MAVSTFAVFGMTRGYAMADARKRTPTHRFEKDKDGKRFRVEMTSEEWEAAVQARADSIMGGARVAQLCQPFDAPQFAREFIRLMREQQECRDLRIRAKAIKKDGSGRPLTHKKTGAPIVGWQDWKDA